MRRNWHDFRYLRRKRIVYERVYYYMKNYIKLKKKTLILTLIMETVGVCTPDNNILLALDPRDGYVTGMLIRFIKLTSWLYDSYGNTEFV